MKKFIYPLFLCTLCVLLNACDNTNPPIENEETNPLSSGDPTLETQMAIIKLSTGMMENIFVTPIVDSCVVDYSNNNLSTLYYGDGLVLCNPTMTDSVLSEFAKDQLHIIGTNPYVLLDEGYAIIDWKWAHFQPLSGAYRSVLYSSSQIINHKMAQDGYSTNFYYLNGTLANEAYYLLPIHWRDLTDLRAIWPMAEGSRIEKPEVIYVKYTDIEKYGDYAVGYQNLKRKYHVDAEQFYTLYNLYKSDSTLFNDYIGECNNLQSSYVKTLNQMINNKDLIK